RVYGPTRTSAPWPNLGRGRGTESSPATAATARNAASQPYAPSATATRTRESSASSRARNGAQLSRSDGSGLFAGGAHRTAAATYASTSANPSSIHRDVGWLASPTAWRAANRKSP